MRPREPTTESPDDAREADPAASRGAREELASTEADAPEPGLDEAIGFAPLDAAKRTATGARRATEPNWVPARQGSPLRRPVAVSTARQIDQPVIEHTQRGLTRAQLGAAASRQLPHDPTLAPPPTASPEPAGHGPDVALRRTPIADATVTAFAPAPSRLLPNATRIALVLLFFAVALPTAAGPPWERLAHPAEVTLQALAALILIGVVHLAPSSPRRRARVGLALGLVLVIFAAVAMRVALTEGAFDGQPALLALFAGATPWPASFALAALVLVPGALFGRTLGAPLWHRFALGFGGLGAAVVTALLVPIGGLFESIGDSPFLGDRVGAFATLPLLAGLLVSPFSLALGSLGRSCGAVGYSLWGAALLPLVVLALFCARSDQWPQVLEPLKLVAFVGATTLYLAAALAASFSRRR